MTKATIAPLLLLWLSASPLPAATQHAPLVEHMAGTAPAEAASPAPPPAIAPATKADIAAPAPARTQIGDTARALLRMQADGSHAGNALPTLGETASRSYQRYLKSFEHPIPEYFEATLPATTNAGSGSRR